MNQALYEIVLARLTNDPQIPGEVADRILSACDRQPDRGAPARAATLHRIAVSGFRGIGPGAELTLKPGPGLTLVVGRNGSGKSSFAEALQVILTGDSSRWKEKSLVWKEGWRNLHADEPPTLQASFWVEGEAELFHLTRTWPEGAGLEGGKLTGRFSLQDLGWHESLIAYPPFLSYSDLGKVYNEGPSAMHDALYAILGLGELSEAEKRLRDERLPLDRAVKDCKAEARSLADGLAGSTDPRAQECRMAFKQKPWPLAVLERHAVSRPTPVLPPERARVEQAAGSVRAASAQLAALRGTDAARSRLVAQLLEQALALHAEHGEQDCPVCKAPGVLTAGWHEAARAEAEQLRATARACQEAEEAVRAALRAARQLCAVPEEVDPAMLEAWTAWSALPEQPEQAAEHLITAYATLEEKAHQARAVQEQRESQWRPFAQRLAAWLPSARQLAEKQTAAEEIKRAEDWLKACADEIKAQRAQPIYDAARKFYSQLRQDSNVELLSVSLRGAPSSPQRRLALEVKVDDVEGVALGVMSQGELNALALSLFLPRAMMPESPFGFVVIDDPVQAMDPAKVDGLAQVLEDAARTRQVLVFTHDTRLYESVRRLGIRAEVIEVHRRERSRLELRPALTPSRRALEDAWALIRTDDLDPRAASRVVPRFCRDAVESVLADVARRSLLGQGRPHTVVEDLLRQADTLNKLASLALTGTLARVSDAQQEIRRLGHFETFQALNKGSHDAHCGNLENLVESTQELVRGLQR